MAIAFQPEPAGQFGGVMLAQGIVEGGDLDQVGLDDAAAGGGFRKQPGDQRGEALQAGAGVGHVGGAEADVGQGFGARRDGRVEPLARTQGDEVGQAREFGEPVGLGCSGESTAVLLWRVGRRRHRGYTPGRRFSSYPAGKAERLCGERLCTRENVPHA